jgi:hypothetical protein
LGKGLTNVSPDPYYRNIKFWKENKQMPRFRIGYSEESYGWYYFDADNAEKAQELIELVEEGELEAEELPAFYKKENGGQHEWINDLEELDK